MGKRLWSLKWSRFLPPPSSLFLPYSKEDKFFCVLPVASTYKKTKFNYSTGDLTFELCKAQNDTPLQEMFPALLKEEFSIVIESCTIHNDVKKRSGCKANSTYAHTYTSEVVTLVLPRQVIGFPRDDSDKPYLIPIFPLTTVLVIRLFFC
jgi:hypothetical protein